MHAFINGYHWGRLESGEILEDPLYDNFNKWIDKELHLKTSHGWSEKTLFYFGDEREAFDKAKEFWEKYKAQEVSARTQ